MTWAEIKKAAAQTGVSDDEPISLIQCENGNRDHTFHKVRLGKTVKLVENVLAIQAREDASGCAV
jgi:hypothetical protein